jgi:hypothetical protein
VSIRTLHSGPIDFWFGVAVALTGACSGPPAASPPARIMAGLSDTVVVNSHLPARIPIRVLDAAGSAISDTGVRLQWVSGITTPISAAGQVTCVQSGDATLRATLGRIATDVLLRCRPVETVRIAGPVQLIVGDTAHVLAMAAFGPDARPVDPLTASVWIGDSTIAAVEGSRVRPLAQGATLVAVTIGGREGRAGVHVYERASTLDGLREQRLLAVSLRLVAGEMRRWRLPPGEWMLAMWPEEDEKGLRLRVEGANCMPSQLTKRRYVCLASHEASIIVYAPWMKGPSSELIGTLAVRPVGTSR